MVAKVRLLKWRKWNVTVGIIRKIDGRNASLGLAFREIGNAFLVHVMSHSGDGKGTNNNIANVKTGFGIN
jgi:hypothetical protein